MIDNVTTQIVLFKKRQKSDGTYPVKIRVTYKREKRFYRTGYNISKEHFEAVVNRPRGKYKELSIIFSKLEERARTIIDSINPFSFEEFKQKWLGKSPIEDDLTAFYKKKIAEMLSNDSPRTADVYRTSIASLKSFKKNIDFKGVTPAFLRDFEKHMYKNEKSTSTISIYLRCLRTIYNEAIRKGKVAAELYPFGKGKYIIPASENIKQALPLSSIKKIFQYPAEEGSQEQYARDLWIFSYLCNGINMVDISLLRWNAIQGNKVTFIRKKTASNKRSQKPIQVMLIDQTLQIIDRWGVVGNKPKGYVFNILKESLTAERQTAVIKQNTKQVNKYLKRICEKIGIDKITTYSARHSFATVMKQSGMSIEYISEALGHSNVNITENYLDSFEDKTKLEAVRKLVDF